MSFLSKLTPSWSWAPALVLGGFVVVQFTMIRLATRGFEGPDQVQYYKLGLEYSREIQRQKVQRQLGWRLVHDGDRVRLLDRAGRPLSGQLTITDQRPATRGQDRTQVVPASGDGYRLPDLPGPGQWVRRYRFRSEGQEWRAQERTP